MITIVRWRLGRLGSWYIYRVRGYQDGDLLRTGPRALLDPAFKSILEWGGYFRFAGFWRLVRANYRAQKARNPYAYSWPQNAAQLADSLRDDAEREMLRDVVALDAAYPHIQMSPEDT